jgi:indolepyruvate decarboxylase
MVRFDQKPVIFLINNDGYTIERLIYRGSVYYDIHPWRYGRALQAFDIAGRAVVHLATTDAELVDALQATRQRSRLHFIELILSKMDAPEALVRFANTVAQFDFPPINHELSDYEASLRWRAEHESRKLFYEDNDRIGRFA